MRGQSYSLMAALLIGFIALAGSTGCEKPAQSTERQNAVSAPPEAEVAEAAAVTDSADETVNTVNGMEALQQAAKAEKYLFVFFKKADDEDTVALQALFQQTMTDLSDRANGVVVNIKDETQEEIVEEYGVDRAPMPLVLAVAPNGAITGGFPTKFEKQQLVDAIATPSTQKCMKALQERKLVFLCVQNDDTKLNEAALNGVRAFRDDDRFAAATEIVMVDPADSAEQRFLKDLQVSADTEQAVTVFLLPPGMPVAKYEGATTKDELIETLSKASSSCGPGGCGPGGCGPQ